MADLSDEEYFAIARRAYAAFRQLPNVHSVGLGSRERAGRLTGERALVVFVSKKQPTSQLQPQQVVPAEFEGVPTDIVALAQMMDIQSLSTVPGVPLGGPYVEDSGRYRPLKGGSQISGGDGRSAGTLGFLARVAGDQRVMAVTCKHVLFPGQAATVPNTRVGQPTPDESFTKCCQGMFGTFVAGYYEANVDAAIIQLDPSTDWLAEIEGIGPVRGLHTLQTSEVVAGTCQVRKRGQRTGLTGGIVRSIGTSGSNTNSRTWTNGIVIQPNPDSSSSTMTFGDHGDSGSALLNASNEVVGLLFSINLPTVAAPNPPNVGWGTAEPIADIIAKFTAANSITLQVATATTLNDVQHTAAAAPASVTPSAVVSPVALRLEADLAQTERGRALTALWLRHGSEINRLVNGSRRVAVRWHRSGGAALFQHVVRAAHSGSYVIPPEVNGRSVDACVAEIVATLAEHGSATLRRDLDAWRDMLPPLAGRRYAQMLAALAPDDRI